MAKKILEDNGHEVVPYRPPGLLDVYELYGQFMAADGWKNTKELLRHGEVDTQSLGLLKALWRFPERLARVAAPIIGNPLVVKAQSFALKC